MKNKKIDVAENIIECAGSAVASYYDKMMMDTVLNQTQFCHFGNIIGYKKVKQPVYLTIKIPVISKDYDDDYEYGTGDFKGLLISLKEIRLFKIGTKIIEEPIYEERKNKGMIKFTRYSPLKQKEIIKKNISKLNNKFEP